MKTLQKPKYKIGQLVKLPSGRESHISGLFYRTKQGDGSHARAELDYEAQPKYKIVGENTYYLAKDLQSARVTKQLAI